MTGADLRQRRQALGLTQVALAELLHCSQHDLSRWESGAIRITALRAEWLDRRLCEIEVAAPTA